MDANDRRREWFRFENPVEERAYRDQGVEKFSWLAAPLALFGLIGFVTYSQFDTDSSVVSQLRMARFGVVVPLLGIMAALGLVRRFRRYWQWQILVSTQIAQLGAVWMNGLLEGTSPFGYSSPNYVLNLIVIMVSAVIIAPLSAGKAFFIALSIAASYAVTTFFFLPEMSPELVSNVFNLLYIGLCCMLAAAWRDASFRSLFRERQKVSNERNLLSVILSEIVPTDVAISIKQGHKVSPKAFGEVAVLFADMVGFTSLSGRIGPKHLVEVLDRMFTRFDDLVAELDLEKVKTIGDAYMVVGGTGADRPDVAAQVVTLGWRMIRETESIARETGLPLQMRIGVHVGSVIGGVIGRTRMAFDYWGDAVNLASRLEANGQAGRVQVSEAAYMRLNGKFALESERTLTLKGKGEVKAYLLAPPGDDIIG
jgi:adenylate cyclase